MLQISFQEYISRNIRGNIIKNKHVLEKLRKYQSNWQPEKLGRNQKQSEKLEIFAIKKLNISSPNP